MTELETLNALARYVKGYGNFLSRYWIYDDKKLELYFEKYSTSTLIIVLVKTDDIDDLYDIGEFKIPVKYMKEKNDHIIENEVVENVRFEYKPNGTGYEASAYDICLMSVYKNCVVEGASLVGSMFRYENCLFV